MFTLSKASEYAILFLVKLAGNKNKKPLNLKQITVKAKLPYKFLSRIVLDLKKAGIITSKEGVSGGYLLKKNPNNISLMQIIKAVEGNKGFVSCIHGQCAMEKPCHHKKVWQKLQQTIEKEFEKVKLSNLIN